MTAGLRIAKGLELPLDTVTDTIGVLAVKGAGKTFTFLVVVEEMIRAGLPVVVLDPVGVCWGLRASADGKGPGLPVVILGGAHGDAPLEPASGKVIADFVVEARRPIVLDFSGFETKAEQLRFSLDFLTELYRKNREPLHVVIDEADDLAPQKPFGEETRVLRALEVLVRRGRARGIGCTLVTQRAAVINKNVLTQVGTLIVGRTIAPQDRKAIEAWIDVHGTDKERATLMGSLASLPTKEKWIWNPTRDVFERVVIRPRETFDSSATPKMGTVRVEPSALAPVDLDALRARIASTVERARADDPKALRARIAELERRLAAAERGAEESARSSAALTAVHAALAAGNELGACFERMLEPLRKAATGEPVPSRAHEGQRRAVENVLGWARKWVAGDEENGELFARDAAMLRAMVGGARERAPVAPAVVAPGEISATARRAPKSELAGDLGKCERAVLRVLAQRHGQPTTASQAAILSGYSVSSSGFGNALSKLRTLRLIEGSRAELVITSNGRGVAGDVPPLPTGPALLEYWSARLGRCEREVLRVLVEARGAVVAKHTLADRTGYSVTSSGFGNALSKLRTLELITRDGPRAAGLFFEGR